MFKDVLFYSLMAAGRNALWVQQSRAEGEAEGAAEAPYTVVQELLSMMDVSLAKIPHLSFNMCCRFHVLYSNSLN